MTLNPEQFHIAPPGQKDKTHKEWVDAITGKGTYVTISASDALDMASVEAPRPFVRGEFARTDLDKLESGKTSINDFVQLRHSPRLYQVKLERAKWGEPDSLYRHIQKHGIDKSRALWAMRNPNKPDQVVLTEGHHRLAAAHAIDPDMPIPVLDEGMYHSTEAIIDRFSNYNNYRLTEDKNLQKFITNPKNAIKDPKIQRTVKSYSLDKENIRPNTEGAWKQ